MYQKPYTCTEINVLLHFSDLRALILHCNNVRGPTFPKIQNHFNLRERSQNWHTILLSLSNSLYLYKFNRCIWVCEVYDCKWLPKTSNGKIFGFAGLKSLYCIILCQCHRPQFHILSFMFITFSACQFKQVWCWDVDQMLYFTIEKYKKC